MSATSAATTNDSEEPISSPSDRFFALTENSPEALALVDYQGIVGYANRSNARVLGYTPEELLGRNTLDLLHPQDRASFLELLQKLEARPCDPDRIELRFLRRDGSWTWVETMASNLLSEPSVGAIVLSLREISHRRAEEEKLQRLNQQFARSNQELQAFAHTAAHDLIEPLRTVSVLLELLTRKLSLDGQDREIADLIMAGTLRMSVLLEDLLTTATNGQGASPEPVVLADVASQAVNNLRQAISSAGATVEIGPLPTVVGHPSALLRVFQNLISNALKYHGAAAPRVQIRSSLRGSTWVIQVRDNGLGIAEKDHWRVFEPFTRLLPLYADGTGIGLVTCKKIVEDMGGAIWVESEPGLGATFCFTTKAAGACASAPCPHGHQ